MKLILSSTNNIHHNLHLLSDEAIYEKISSFFCIYVGFFGKNSCLVEKATI